MSTTPPTVSDRFFRGKHRTAAWLVLFLALGGREVLAQRPLGIDVSDYQGSINWASVKNSGITFAWAKATEGANSYETTFTNNAVNAKAAGVFIGAYHYAHPELHLGAAGAQLEAAHFWNVAGSYITGSGTYLMPMLDIEEDVTTASPAYTKATLSQWVNVWCSNVVSLAAANGVTVKPVVYTFTSYATGNSGLGPGLDTTATIWPLWMASYPSSPNPQTGAPSSTSPWSSWAVWQYSSTGTVPGISGDSDMDVFNGNAIGLGTLVVGGINSPYFTTQPVNSRVTDTGGNVSFSATAAGTLPLNYQWLFNGAKISGATNATISLASVQTNNAGNYAVVVTNLYGSATSSVITLLVYPPQFTVFADTFETNSAANWTVNQSSGDTAVAFNFDYSALAVPSAPHSAGGTTHGVQLKANLTLGVVAALSISPANQSFSGDYRLHFDAWINVNGPFPGGGASSTEFLTAGIGTAGNRTEWTGSGSTADGYYFSADGDGGVSATSTTTGDYSGYAGKTWQSASSGIYAAGSPDNANSYYTAAFPTGQAAPAAQQANYPQQTGTLNSGTFGFAWHDVIVARRGSTVNWSVDGILFATITNAAFTGSNVCVGFWDPFASLTDNTNLSFGLVDNVRVEIPDPGYNQFLAAYDSGPGFFGGENLVLTNASGNNFYVWSSPYPSVSVTNWTLEGPMGEQPLGASGLSRYVINVNPAASPVYYIFARTNTGLFTAAEALTWLTTSDYASFQVISSNAAISAGGVFAIPAAPAILSPPGGTNIFAGNNAGFSVTATGSGTLGYQWLNAGIPFAGGGNIAGARTNVLNFVSATTNQTGYYSVIVTNALGSVTSSAAFLNVVPVPALYLASSPAGMVLAADGGAGNNRYIIQTATNLAPPIAWQPLQTNVIGGSGQIRFTETNRAGLFRFYRVLFP